MQLLVYSICLGAEVIAFVFSIVALQSNSWIRFQTPADSPFQYTSNYGLYERCDKSNLFPDYRCRPFPRRSTDCVDQDALHLSSLGFGLDASGFVSPVFANSSSLSAASPLLTISQAPLRPSSRRRCSGKRSTLAPMESAFLEAQEGQGDDRFGFCELWHTAGYSAQISVAIGVATLVTVLVVLVGNAQRKANGWRLVAGLISVHAAFGILTFAIMFHLFATDSRFYIGSRLGHATFFNVASWAVDAVVVVALVAAALAGAVDVDGPEDERAGYEEIRDDD